MTMEIFFRVLMSGIFSLIISWTFFSRVDSEVGSEHTDHERQKYLPYTSGTTIPTFLLVLGTVFLFYFGIKDTAKVMIDVCFTLFPHICLYYIILIPLLPFLRKHISARACAMMWLLPNYLYIIYNTAMELPEPLLVIHTPGNMVWILFYIWLTGFVAVLLWKTIEHYSFRNNILRDITPITDDAILQILNDIVKEARMPKPIYKLVSSPHVKSPITVGLFRRKMHIILPEHNYTPEELELILKHEIIHIAREDAWSKFFLVFCTAMCWFNPLMWIAMKKCAEDIELSCDETVLIDADQTKRKKYASLLLNVTSDDRGYSSCLSSRAKTMHYRIQSIMNPKKRLSGALILGLIYFILAMTSGYVSLAYNNQSGEKIIYKNDVENYELDHIRFEDYYDNYKITDEKAFHNYLSDLTLSEFTGNYSFSTPKQEIYCSINTPNGTEIVILHDNVIESYPLYGENRRTTYYYVKEGIDLDYIKEMAIKE